MLFSSLDAAPLPQKRGGRVERRRRRIFRPGIWAAVAAFILFVSAAAVAVPLWLLSLYAGNQEYVESTTDPPRLIAGGEMIDETPWITGDGRILVPVPAAERLLDAKLWWEPDEAGEGGGTLTITMEDRVIDMRTRELTALVNEEPLQLDAPVEVRDGVPHIPVDLLEALYGARFTYHPETGRLVLDRPGEAYAAGRIRPPQPLEGTPEQRLRSWLQRLGVEKLLRRWGGWAADDLVPLRNEPSLQAPILAELEAGAGIRIVGESEGWLYAQTEEGLLGYLQPHQVALGDVAVVPEDGGGTAGGPGDGSGESAAGGEGVGLPPVTDWSARRPGSPLSGSRLTLVWEQVDHVSPDPATLGNLQGVDVVAPTWFVLADEEGRFHNRADRRYVDWAHARGIEVWGVATNAFDPDLTSQVLASRETRRRMIRQLLAYAELYDLDGINLDIENVHLSDRDRVTQFVRELAPAAHAAGLTLSMDVTVKSQSPNWSLFYDRKALAEVVDYVALMAYDEHGPGYGPGPTASLPWVENGLRGVLEEVPAEKLLLGVPFYTRIWEVDESGAEQRTEAVTMRWAKQLAEQHQGAVVWDEEAQQYYVEYWKDGVRRWVWLEDETSLDARLQLVQKYNLAGVAAWRRGYEPESIWPQVEAAMGWWP